MSPVACRSGPIVHSAPTHGVQHSSILVVPSHLLGGSHPTRHRPVVRKRTAGTHTEIIRSPRPMSNPSIATKLITLVKGVFGRKEPVSASVPAEEAGESAAAEQAQKTEGRVEESATEGSRVETTTEPAAESTAEPAEKDKVAKDKSAKGESKVSPSESADEKDQKAKESEDPAPATEDVPEKKKESAEEIAVAEADTTVADEEVLEKVRKEAAPAAEDLAVP